MDDDGLDGLRAEIARCRICRDAPFGGPERQLPHEPRPVAVLSRTARILIAGQAPGLRVHDSGQPFNDASGDRLRTWLDIGRETFYDPHKIAIVPMGFCFPGYDRHGSDLPPRRECAPRWRGTVLGTMPQVELVLAIGHYAQKWHLGRLCPPGMTETVKAWRSFLDPAGEGGAGNGPAILPLPHPSWRNTGWIKRNPWFEAELVPALRSHVKTLLS